jgi:hypothetical protein
LESWVPASEGRSRGHLLPSSAEGLTEEALGRVDLVLAGAFNTPGGFHSFEHRWALKEAFEFHRNLGRDKVAAKPAHSQPA